MRRYVARDLIALTYVPTDDAGAAISVSSPATVTVYDPDGAEVATGTAVANSSGLSYSLAGSAIAELGVYTVEWAAMSGGVARVFNDDTTAIEIVGAFIITLADIRARDDAFKDATKYPASYLESVARDPIEEFLEENSMCAFRPKGARVVLHGSGRQKLIAPHTDLRRVYHCKVDGTALTTDELAALKVLDNVIYRDAGWPEGFANVELHYEYGYDRVPGPIKRAALQLAKEYVVPSNIPSRATATTVDDMTYRITIAGRDGYSGIPDVDAAIEQFGRVRPVVG